MRLRPEVVLLPAAFLTFFDRALLPPQMISIAQVFAVEVADIGHVMTGYVIAYGLGQVFWGLVSSRTSPFRAMGVSIAVAAAGNLMSALAPDPLWLLIGRVLSGTGFSAMVLTALVYIGDTLPLRERVPAAAQLAVALSLGMTAGTLAGAALSDGVLWRWSYVIVIAALLLLAFGLRMLRGEYSGSRVPIIGSFSLLVRNPWVLLILVLTVLEGALLIGVVSFIPVVLEQAGYSTFSAGAITALFGIAVVVSSQAVRPLARLLPGWVLLFIAGAVIVLAFAMVAFWLHWVTAVACTVLLGFAWSVGHTQLQAWMTDASKGARPVGMSLFGLALFGGAAMGTSGSTYATQGEGFSSLFALAAAVGLVLAIVAAGGRAKYVEQDQREVR